jgi:hypothetical protein
MKDLWWVVVVGRSRIIEVRVVRVCLFKVLRHRASPLFKATGSRSYSMILTSIVEKSLPHAWRFRCPDVGLLKILMPSLYISMSWGHKRGLLGVTRDAVAFLPSIFLSPDSWR